MTDETQTVREADSLLPALVRLAALQREAVDRLALQEAVAASSPQDSPQARLTKVVDHLHLAAARWRAGPDAADLPALLAGGAARAMGHSARTQRQRPMGCRLARP